MMVCRCADSLHGQTVNMHHLHCNETQSLWRNRRAFAHLVASEYEKQNEQHRTDWWGVIPPWWHRAQASHVSCRLLSKICCEQPLRLSKCALSTETLHALVHLKSIHTASVKFLRIKRDPKSIICILPVYFQIQQHFGELLFLRINRVWLRISAPFFMQMFSAQCAFSEWLERLERRCASHALPNSQSQLTPVRKSPWWEEGRNIYTVKKVNSLKVIAALHFHSNKAGVIVIMIYPCILLLLLKN